VEEVDAIVDHRDDHLGIAFRDPPRLLQVHPAEERLLMAAMGAPGLAGSSAVGPGWEAAHQRPKGSRTARVRRRDFSRAKV
jgi:hypothetical protein